jgi:hypothetical protein
MKKEKKNSKKMHKIENKTDASNENNIRWKPAVWYNVFSFKTDRWLPTNGTNDVSTTPLFVVLDTNDHVFM